MTEKVPIRFEASAKLEVKTEIPAEASGRVAHAMADAISPLTEWLGLMGDKLRIHRTIVVHKLLKKAEEQIALEDKCPEPIPIKVAVPLIEHASQEEADDDFMISIWAKLLASATKQGSIPPRFVRIVSELNSTQARLLAFIGYGEIHRSPQELTEYGQFALQERARKAAAGRPFGPGFERVAPRFVQAVFSRRTAATFVRLSYSAPGQVNMLAGHKSFVNPALKCFAAVDFNILESLGLIRPGKAQVSLPLNDYLAVSYCGLTGLGAALLRATQSPPDGAIDGQGHKPSS